jgi:hypothetical protein
MLLSARRLVGPALLLATAAAAAPARAAPGAVALSIDCPSLDAEARALLEARTRAELASESTEGALGIACTGASVTLVWRPAGGARRERTVPLAADAASAVDPLLEEIHALSASSPPRAPEPEPAHAGVPAPADAAATAPPGPSRWGITAGVDSETWQGGIPAALGAHAGGRVALSARWSVRALAGPAWGLSAVDGLRAWRLRGLARLEYAPWPQLELGAGAVARVLWAGADSGVAPSGRTGATAGAVLSARYALAAGPISMSAGPELEALVRPVLVEVSGAEAFRMPTFVLGVSLDASTR